MNLDDKQILDQNKILHHYSHQVFSFDNYLKLPKQLFLLFKLNLVNRNSNCVLEFYFHLINLKFSKKLDIYSKKVKLLINDLLIMIEFRRTKKNRSKNALFNPYKNGISSYDMAYLSSKRVLKNKTVNLKSDSEKDYLAA